VVVDQRAYLNGGTGFKILDVSQPYTPTFLGSYSGPDWLSIKEVIGSLAYGIYTNWANEYIQDNTLWVFDVSDPTDPVLIGDCYLGFK